MRINVCFDDKTINQYILDKVSNIAHVYLWYLHKVTEE